MTQAPEITAADRELLDAELVIEGIGTDRDTKSPKETRYINAAERAIARLRVERDQADVAAGQADASADVAHEVADKAEADLTAARALLVEAGISAYAGYENTSAVSVPSSGWQVVPITPTEAMKDALNGYAQCIGYIDEGYKAMLAAVPRPSEGTEPAPPVVPVTSEPNPSNGKEA